MIKVRFAPSPTGYLHLGGARTALFNWLYAKSKNGKFYLRIEDTDLARSTKENIDAIYRSLKWLGIDWDDEPVIQSKRIDHHQKAVAELLEKGKAYKCYCTKEELDKLREEANAKKQAYRYPGICRDLDPSNAPEGKPYVVRFKMPQEGETAIHDGVQGDVTIHNSTIEDFVLLRQDGTPTYMVSVVVDDHDMGITHIIRGDDHLTNSFKQYQLYKALGWDVPEFFHIPLIHGQDGAKLSKRHGAVGVESYKEEGILPEAMLNYLLRLGWSKGDEEIIPVKKAIEWFDTRGLGKSPSRFNRDKLLSLNSHYLRDMPNEEILNILDFGRALNDDEKAMLIKGMDGLKKRAKTLIDLQEGSRFYITRPEEKEEIELDDNLISLLKTYLQKLENLDAFNEEHLLNFTREFATENNVKLVAIAQPLRVAVTGKTVSPSVFEIMEILGKNETCGRIRGYLNS